MLNLGLFQIVGEFPEISENFAFLRIFICATILCGYRGSPPNWKNLVDDRAFSNCPISLIHHPSLSCKIPYVRTAIIYYILSLPNFVPKSPPFPLRNYFNCIIAEVRVQLTFSPSSWLELFSGLGKIAIYKQHMAPFCF